MMLSKPPCLLLLLQSTAAAAYSYGGLPPLLQFINGSTVSTPAEWELRRAEILASLSTTIYGTFPETTPSLVSVATLNETATGRGHAVLWLNASFSVPGPVRTCAAVFEVIVPDLCTASARCPAFFSSKEHRRWGAVAAGRAYVAINANIGDNGCDTPACALEDSTGCFKAAYPSATFQLIGRRGWLAGRVLDAALAAVPAVDPARVGIAGHSRNGKSSLIAAALDPRFAAVVDSSSGAAGIAAYRLSGGPAECETPAGPWPGPWFLPSLAALDGSEDALPVDANAVAGLVAPRPLLLAMAHNDAVLDTLAVEAALQAVRPVYALLGAPPNAAAVDYRPGDHHGYEDIARYCDWFDTAFGHSLQRQAMRLRTLEGAGADEADAAYPYPLSHWDAGGPYLLHSFNWSAWAARQPSPLPVPAPNATPAERVAWGLGEAPLSGPVADPGGSYPPAGDLGYVDQMQGHTATYLGGAVVRAAVAFGPNIISGSLLYRPDMMPGSGRAPPAPAGWPAVVWLGGLDYNKGWVQSYTTDSAPLPAALANASLVVLTYEQLGFGLRQREGAQFYDRFPRWSKMGAMAHEARAAVDALAWRGSGGGGAAFQPAGAGDALPPFPPVDPTRIYLAGYSVGGAAALYAAATDARVAGVATVSGWTPMRLDTDAARSGGIRRWWQLHATQPALGAFAGTEGALPLEWDDVLTLVAPRPVYAHQPAGDRHCDAAAVAALAAALKTRDPQRFANLTVATPPGINAVDAVARQALVAWLTGQVAAPPLA